MILQYCTIPRTNILNFRNNKTKNFGELADAGRGVACGGGEARAPLKALGGGHWGTPPPGSS